MTLLFAILTKNTSFRSYRTFAYLLHVHIRNINMRMYITNACEHGSMCIRADANNLIYALYYYAPWPWPCTVYMYDL